MYKYMGNDIDHPIPKKGKRREMKNGENFVRSRLLRRGEIIIVTADYVKCWNTIV